jgi:S1-C subfamily serine protease
VARAQPQRAAWLIAVAAAVVIVMSVGVAIVLLVGRGKATSSSALVSSSVGSPTRSAAPLPKPQPATPPAAPDVKAPTAPPAAGSFADLYKTVQSGVVRISASTCDGGAIGTGFLVSPTLVATAAHVVDGAAALGLQLGQDGKGGYTSGVVVGMDRESDVALIKTQRSLSGHIFTFADEPPAVGQEVAAIGFPEDEPMTLTRGTVSGLDRTIEIEGTNRSGLIQTDTAINPGNSGGPMLATSGLVYGVVDAKRDGAEGIAYAVSPQIASSRVARWKGHRTSVVSSPCDAPVAPPLARGQEPEQPNRQDPTSESVASFFAGYFAAVNAADYDAVWSMLGPNLRGRTSARLARGLSTTLDTGMDVQAVTPKRGGKVLAHVSFTSFQAPEKGPDGDTCDNWDLDYLLAPVGGSWQISAASGHQNGPTHSTC